MRRNPSDGIEWVGASGLMTGQSPHTYRKGRVCAASGCATLLSRYNPTKRCSMHGELH
jgi:hypothetical protein